MYLFGSRWEAATGSCEYVTEHLRHIRDGEFLDWLKESMLIKKSHGPVKLRNWLKKSNVRGWELNERWSVADIVEI